MRFAIRDDDTSYFTRPDALEAVWGRVLPYAPVSLAVTPFALRATHMGDPVRFYQGPDSGAVAENRELVLWINSHIAAGRASVMCHGATHEYLRRSEFELIPEYIWKPPARIAAETGRARRHLEETFGVPVNTFVPPGNGISRRSIDAIRPHFRSVLASVSLRRPSDLRADLAWPRLAARRLYFQLRHGIIDPFGGQIQGTALLPSFPLTASTRWEQIERQLAACARLGADFVVGTHYWEVGDGVRDVLDRLLDRAATLGCRFCTCDQLFGSEPAPPDPNPGRHPVLANRVGQQEGSPAR
ncbi:MAG: hypothetical protein R2729_08155 [Bryobacteraceae bacterium]